MDHRRQHVRRLLQVDAFITDMHGRMSASTQIIDISRMGVAFVSEQPMPTDEQYLFNFCFPGSTIRNELTVAVVHSTMIGSQGRYRNGARFLAISEACADRIVDFVTSSTAGAPSV